jgi:prevent-host-death family protein
MEIINVHKAKTNLSSLIDRALKGEKIIIARKGKPVVTLQKLEKSKKKRIGGQFKGKIKIAKDFDSLPEDFMKHFQ